MQTIKHNGKDVPVVEADVKVTIKNKETGVVYKDDEEWKTLGIDPQNIKRDVVVKMPRLDLLAKTK
jgi:hypothetical protein|tara:strand:- start:35 stop:232 length:198 start_codon:yes stop_codon:yes gene_type:complete